MRRVPPTSVVAWRPAGNLLADPGFEAGLGGWRAGGGARLEQVAEPRSGAWAGVARAATALN